MPQMLRGSNASLGQIFLQYSKLWIQVSMMLSTSAETKFSLAADCEANKDETLFQSSQEIIFRIYFLSIYDIAQINMNTDQIQLILSHLISEYKPQKMMRSLQKIKWSFSTRKQNFFQLNPIYPSMSQKDFDIYNYKKKNIRVVDGFQREFQREFDLKDKIVDEFIRAKYIPKEKENVYDPDTGLPLGLNEDYDAFISVFKQKIKLGATIFEDYADLEESLFQKFKVKSEFQLIKLFRISIANAQKNTIKDHFRAMAMQEAIYKASLDRKNFIGFLEKESHKLLSAKEQNRQILKKSLKSKTDTNAEGLQTKSQTLNKGQQSFEDKKIQSMNQQQFEENLFLAILNNIDKKIIQAEEKMRKQVMHKYGWKMPDYHPEFGPRITEQSIVNPNIDLNSPIGHSQTIVTSNEERYSLNTKQDAYIRSRINKLYYLRRLNSLNELEEIDSKVIIRQNELPIQIRQKDKIINQIAHKYKEYDLIVQPDLQEIYNEIDIVLSKIDIKISPNISQSEQKYIKDQRHFAKEKVLTKEQMLWESLDLDQAFSIGEYSEEHLSQTNLDYKEVKSLSTREDVEMSLAKVPFNLYRHSDLEVFGIFTKHRNKILKDYLTDESYLPHEEFQSFSLVKAQEELRKAKRVEIKDDSCVGTGKRKTSEAQVTIRPGNGKVTINGKRLEDYFADVYHRAEALKPLAFTNTSGLVDLEINVVGGGAHGQSECISIALSNALIKMEPRYEPNLYAFGLVGTDDRKKEPKRIGLYSARVRPPYVRR